MPESTPSRLWSVVFAIGFAVGMAAHEVMMEQLFRLPHQPQNLALWVSVSEFGFCWLVPALLEVASCLFQKCATLPDIEIQETASVMPGSDSLGVVTHARRWLPYVALSLLMTVQAAVSTQSARYVDYGVKVVFKSSKLLPTMLSATLMGNSRKFGIIEYIAALCLCAGSALFSSEETQGAKAAVADPSLLLGAICLSISICFDAVTPNAQQRLMRDGTSPNSIQLRLNLLGTILSSLAAVASGGMGQTISFVKRFHMVISLFVGMGVTLAFTIMCQIRLIKTAGSVVAVGVGTLRKSLTLLLSYMIFPGKHFGIVRVVGVILVAIGLLIAEYKNISDKAAKQTLCNPQAFSGNEPLESKIGVETSIIDISSKDERHGGQDIEAERASDSDAA